MAIRVAMHKQPSEYTSAETNCHWKKNGHDFVSEGLLMPGGWLVILPARIQPAIGGRVNDDSLLID
jgi:hypothetical protein